MRLASFRFVVAIHSPVRECGGTMRLIEIAVVITCTYLATTCALNGFSTLVMTEREGWLKESGKTSGSLILSLSPSANSVRRVTLPHPFSRLMTFG